MQISWLVFSDDWGRHPSSCQHLFRHIVQKEPVVWVNTIGMRAPSLDRATLRRAMEKLRQWTWPPKLNGHRGQAAPQVVAPLMWPWVRRSWERALNAWLLRRALTRTTANLKPPRVAVTTIPLVVDIVEKLPIDLWVYYCVDDWSTWLGLDNQPLKLMEDALVKRVHCCVAVNEILQQNLLSRGVTSYLLPHGVDWPLWNKSHQPHPKLKEFEKPIIVQWGMIDQKLNVEWLLRVANTLEQGTVALVGPVVSVPETLAENRRIRILPAVPYDELPQLAAAADVLVMAYRIHSSIVASSPLKLKEYLLSGKPVIVPDIPEVKSWSDCLDIARSTEDFVRLVQLRSKTGVPPSQLEARRRLEKESWKSKATQFRNFVVESLKAVELGPIRPP